MGLKCSVLGHRFGDPDVEREREERGSEVVTTTREVAVCERCGDTRVLSENKEVTAIIDESEIDGGSGTAGEPATGQGGQPGGDQGHEPGTPPDSESESETEPEPDGDDLVSEAVKNVQAERDASGGMADIDVPEENEGAEILSDDADEDGERGYGEWPTEPGDEPEPWDPDSTNAADAEPAESTGSDPEGADGQREDSRAGDEGTGTDGRPFGTGRAEDATADTGAEIIDADPDSSGHRDADTADPGHDAPSSGDADATRTDPASESSPVDGAAGNEGDGSEIIDAEDHLTDEPASHGSQPGSPESDDAEASEVGKTETGRTGAGGDTDDAPVDAEATEQAAGSGDGSEAKTEASFEETEAASPSRPDAYECPECGFETAATNSPLRAGDPCPECSAYLVGSERKN